MNTDMNADIDTDITTLQTEINMENLINDFRSYISVGDENNNYQTWEQIADYLQEVTLEESSEPFEELN